MSWDTLGGGFWVARQPSQAQRVAARGAVQPSLSRTAVKSCARNCFSDKWALSVTFPAQLFYTSYIFIYSILGHAICHCQVGQGTVQCSVGYGPIWGCFQSCCSQSYRYVTHTRSCFLQPSCARTPIICRVSVLHPPESSQAFLKNDRSSWAKAYGEVC